MRDEKRRKMKGTLTDMIAYQKRGGREKIREEKTKR